jgi:RNAse (barnase) inhibitor barstar
MIATDLRTASWACVHFLDESALSPLVQTLGSMNVRAEEIGVPPISSAGDLFRQIARAFEFPTYVGQNWDAVEEALRDLEWLPAPGYTLIVRQARHVWVECPEVAGMLIEVWLTAAEWWADSETAFHLIFEL